MQPTEQAAFDDAYGGIPKSPGPFLEVPPPAAGGRRWRLQSHPDARTLHRIHPRRGCIAQVLGYFRRHTLRRNGREQPAHRLWMFEAACKTLATPPASQGNSHPHLRALIQSRRFEQAWEMLSQA